MTDHTLFTPEAPLRIGTRSSPLAMAQAHMAADLLRTHLELPEAAVILRPMLASGDKIQDRPLADIGGKALWTKELERALLDGAIDVAVHSMKDVETMRPDIFSVAAMLPRADIRDRLIGAQTIAALPTGAKVGTSSPRRRAQLKRLRPDLVTAPIRGNVATRLGKIANGEYDATILAAAGLDRLSMQSTGTVIEVCDMLPAASQGAIGIETLRSRPDIEDILNQINDDATYVCVMAERAFLAALGGTCHSPVAALAQIDNDKIWLRAEILSEDGDEYHGGEIRFDASDHSAPQSLAHQLLSQSSDAIQSLFTIPAQAQ
jgi:hydroxymethylbilane synthase